MFTVSAVRRYLFAILIATCAVQDASAQWAVVDVGAIARLVQQLNTMRQQLDTARNQLDQARTQYEAMTGNRGMEAMLRGVERNYLPRNWNELTAAMEGRAGNYGALSAEIRTAVEANAVLTPAQLARLSVRERQDLLSARQANATFQALARQSLAVTSQRFASLEQLIDAIGRARDQKAALDLQARIAAETTMLENEHAKLDVLLRAAQAEVDVQRMRTFERAIDDIGSLRRLPPLQF